MHGWTNRSQAYVCARERVIWRDPTPLYPFGKAGGASAPTPEQVASIFDFSQPAVVRWTFDPDAPINLDLKGFTVFEQVTHYTPDGDIDPDRPPEQYRVNPNTGERTAYSAFEE